MSTSFILLKGGRALIHDENDDVKKVKTDILIEGNIIIKVDKNIDGPSGAQVIDCTDKLISPGFIDTHHHVWQTQLRGRHANETLLEYVPTGNMQSHSYTPADFFWGELGGHLEMLHSGTTTVVDHAHMVYSAEAVDAALSATITAGIRSIFAYAPITRLEKFNPLTPMEEGFMAPWVEEKYFSLVSKSPYGENGRVTMGLGYDGFYSESAETISALFAKVAETGKVKTITSHFTRGPQLIDFSLIEMMKAYGVLDERMLISHSSGMTTKDLEILREAKAHISSTPSTEMQMALSWPVAFDDSLPGVEPLCSLGVDCHSATAGSMVSEMRVGLQGARARSNGDLLREEGKAPKHLHRSVQYAFNLATIQGARAVRMGDEIGSIKVGKKADLVIFDAMSASMCCAVEQDGVAAVVLHSSPADVETVIVDGKVRKQDGKLLPMEVDEGGKQFWEGELEWKEVARKLVESRSDIQRKIDGIDMKQAYETVLAVYRIDHNKLV